MIKDLFLGELVLFKRIHMHIDCTSSVTTPWLLDSFTILICN